MGFSAGRFAKIWKLEDKGNYAVANLSISRKNRDTNAYTVEFKDGFVAIVGKAWEALKGAVVDEHNGLTIKIVNCDVTNVYTSQTGKVSYNPHYTIFALELPNDNGGQTAPKTETKKEDNVDDFINVPDGDDEELPFN